MVYHYTVKEERTKGAKAPHLLFTKTINEKIDINKSIRRILLCLN